jgi:hypothetical protein
VSSGSKFDYFHFFSSSREPFRFLVTSTGELGPQQLKYFGNIASELAGGVLLHDPVLIVLTRSRAPATPDRSLPSKQGGSTHFERTVMRMTRAIITNIGPCTSRAANDSSVDVLRPLRV